jgi:hypothetical protein
MVRTMIAVDGTDGIGVAFGKLGRALASHRVGETSGRNAHGIQRYGAVHRQSGLWVTWSRQSSSTHPINLFDIASIA